eukprot:g6128.t1
MRTQQEHELGSFFFDFQDDQEALIQEDEVAQALVHRGCLFEDPAFPASAESLYRTPQQPPAGALPTAFAVWARISQQEVRGCHTPVTFPVGGALAAVAQGALGDSWLVSSLNMLRSYPEALKNIIVSDRHSNKGIFTIKLFKEGTWRYLHVDDRLPCSPSRAPHFCSSNDPNQIWAPLIEKAFAKLHGCYESIGRGSIEQGLRSLTGAPVLRTPLMGLSPQYDHENRKAGGVPNEAASEKHRQELWAKMKKWQDRGCVMGCCRSVEYDRARNRLASSKGTCCRNGSAGRRQTGLMAGRSYGIRRVCDASAEATHTRDAVSFKLVELSCPWGLGQWRGDWSSDSVLWERYPSIKVDLLLRRQHEAGAGVQNGRLNDNRGQEGGEATATAVGPGERAGERGASFWMAFDDFTAEFSQARGSSCQPSSDLPIPFASIFCPSRGHSSQNPFYPVTIQRNSTTVSVCLSVWDRAWQADPPKRGPAIGYYIVRLAGSKPRLTKLRPSKIAARSPSFLCGPQAAGEHTFDAGRYAIVPVTVKPLPFSEAFLLDLTASNTAVEWEQVDDRIRDLDQELKLSDDEGDTASTTSMTAASSGTSVVKALMEEAVESEDIDGPPGNKVAEALQKQIAELSDLVAKLKGENLQHSNSFIMDELGGHSGLDLGFDGVPLSPRELKPGSGLQENGTTVPPHSDAPISRRKSVSVRIPSDVSDMNSFTEVGA